VFERDDLFRRFIGDHGEKIILGVFKECFKRPAGEIGLRPAGLRGEPRQPLLKREGMRTRRAACFAARIS
jgi:hypothetical protein